MKNRSPFMIALAFLAMVSGAVGLPLSASAQDTDITLERRAHARADQRQARADAIRLRAVADLERARQLVQRAETERRIRFEDADVRRRLIESVARCVAVEAAEEQWRCQSVMNLVGMMYLQEPGPFADRPDYVGHNTAALSGAAWRLAYEAKEEATAARRATEELTLVTAEHLEALYGRTGELAGRVSSVEGRTGALETGLAQTRSRLESTRQQTGEDFETVERNMQRLLEEIQRRIATPNP